MNQPTYTGISKVGRSDEVAALLAAARAVVDYRAFGDSARAVLEACKSILGADGGLVSARAAGGGDFELIFLDAGDLDLDASDGLSAPLKRLGERTAKSGRPVFSNRLPATGTRAPRADRRAAPRNALLAPILLAGEVVGFIGLLDKRGGFTAADARLAEVFAEMAAAAMLESRTLNGLEKSQDALEREVRESATHLRAAEEQFRTLVENLPDMIARFDSELRYLYVSPAVEKVTGRPARDYLGRTNGEAGLPTELVEAWDAALRRVLATGRPEKVELTFQVDGGTRHYDCRLVPELGPTDGVPSVLSVARDETDRWLAYEAERRARTVAEALREATVALTRILDRETVLATLLDRLRQIVPFDRARVMLLEDGTRLSVRAVFDGNRVVPMPAEGRPELDPAEHPIVRGILTSGAVVLVPDVRARPDWSLPTDGASEACWMGVPLFARGDVAGLFSLSKSEPGFFNEEHVKLAEAMSSQASVAVENAILFEQMQASSVRMRSLSRRLVEVQESERRNIARELHDEAGQALTSLRLGLRLLEREIGGGGSVTARVAELVQRTDAVIEGLHRLAVDLRPASLDHVGLEAALRQYSRSAGAKFGLDVHFKARGFTDERLPSVVETALYRVVQEAMTNVVRHAGAKRVDVLAERRGDRVLVMVEDDGVGFDPLQVRPGEHLGLLGMRERAEALGGVLTIESRPGAGTTVVAEVPSDDPNPDR